ncbi:hypothetical protein [Arthrobacter sp. E3]|uniref:hypothetical protein n=1 Tax=Arthrobacter sp. E3 TaxID=517402 RepID=UPI001FFDB075|nr:hypothetical protein [Arthrobacter sp. E3]
MTARSRLPGKLARQSFTYREGLLAGVSVSRMRASDLSVPSRGIRVPQEAGQPLLDRVRPYTSLGLDNWVSHVTAAQIHEMPLPWFAEESRTLHLSRVPGSAHSRRRGVAGHCINLTSSDIVWIEGVPLTSPARTFLDLATILSLDDLVAVADHLICEHDRHFGPSKCAIIPEEQLRAYIGGFRHMPGLVKAKRALELMRVGVDSPPETRLRLILHRSGLPEFLPNCKIAGGAGEFDVGPDLACKEYKVCGEYEGEIHQTTEKQLHDRNRDERTRIRGWVQVKVYNADMKRGDAHVVAMFEASLRQQGWRSKP